MLSHGDSVIVAGGFVLCFVGTMTSTLWVVILGGILIGAGFWRGN